MRLRARRLSSPDRASRRGWGRASFRPLPTKARTALFPTLRLMPRRPAWPKTCARAAAHVATFACDVSKADQCRALIAQTVERFGAVDIFVNNAGIGFKMKPLLDVDTSDEWDQVIAVNLSGAFLLHAGRRAGDGGGWPEDGQTRRAHHQHCLASRQTGFPHLPGLCLVQARHGRPDARERGRTRQARHHGERGVPQPCHHRGWARSRNEYFSKLLGFARVEDYLANMAAKNPHGPYGPAVRYGGGLPVGSPAMRRSYVTGEALKCFGAGRRCTDALDRRNASIGRGLRKWR